MDTHTDTATQVFGVDVSHGTPMYRLVRDGVVDPARYVQIGPRGYWPGDAEFRGSGHGTPEPGGMTSLELLGAVREVAQRVELVGADVVEVIPSGVGSADITALVADRIVREILNGIALRRRLH